jgi:hypothetical protein
VNSGAMKEIVLCKQEALLQQHYKAVDDMVQGRS